MRNLALKPPLASANMRHVHEGRDYNQGKCGQPAIRSEMREPRNRRPNWVILFCLEMGSEPPRPVFQVHVPPELPVKANRKLCGCLIRGGSINEWLVNVKSFRREKMYFATQEEQGRKKTAHWRSWWSGSLRCVLGKLR